MWHHNIFFALLALGLGLSDADAAGAFVSPPKTTTASTTTTAKLSKLHAAKSNQPSLSSSPWQVSSSATAPIITAAAIALAVGFASSPATAVTGDITKGSRIFTSTCAGCHAGGNNFVKENKTLKKDALERFVGLDEAKITEFFKKSFVHQIQVGGGKLSEEDVADVISYVVSQAVDEKW